MRLPAVVIALALALAPVALPSAASANPEPDNNAGLWVDTYTNTFGYLVDAPQTVGVSRDPYGQRMTLASDWVEAVVPACCADDPITCSGGEDCTPPAPPAVTGQYTTVEIDPSSFTEWDTLLIDLNENAPGQVVLHLILHDDQGGSTEVGPLTLSPSAAPGFSHEADISVYDDVNAKSIQVIVKLSTQMLLKPTVSKLKLTWNPTSVITATLSAGATACSSSTFEIELPTSVNFVDAQNLVTWVVVPDGVLPAVVPSGEPWTSAGGFSQADALTFYSATSGGQFHGGPGPLSVGGVMVPARSVYWDHGTRAAGETFITSANLRVPVGLLQDTTYTLTAFTAASNAASTVTNSAVVRITPSTPQVTLGRSVSGVYRIDGQNRVYPGSHLTFSLGGRNNGGGCREHYYQGVVFDDVTPIMNAIMDGGDGLDTADFNPTLGGQYTATALTLHGVTIPAQSVYWDLTQVPGADGKLDANEYYSLSYGVDLKPEPPLVEGDVYTQCGDIRSGFQAASAHACATFVIGVPVTPNGTFAKGDRIGNSSQVTADPNDNRYSSATYGERFSWLLYTRNTAVSAINAVFLDMIVPGTTFDSAYLPEAANGEILYYTGSGYLDPLGPPALNPDGSLLDISGWSSAVPANRADVRWVYMYVPVLASTYFPQNHDAPNSVLGEIAVTVDEPTGACVEFTLTNTSHHYITSYIPLGQEGQPPVLMDTPIHGAQKEYANVQPKTPNVSGFLYASASPSTVIGANPVSVNISFSNRKLGSSPMDTMHNTVLVVGIPQTTVNGVVKYLNINGTPTANANSIITTGLPAQISATWLAIQPGQYGNLSFQMLVPRGIEDGATIQIPVTVTGQDDVCGPTTAARTITVSFSADPALKLTKNVDFAVADQGDDLNYTLSYVNTGEAVSQNTWLVDRIDSNLAFVSGRADGLEMWCSDAQPPTLPELLSPSFNFDTGVIAANFQQATATDGNGRWLCPMADPTYVAFRVDDPALTPPQFITDEQRTVEFRATIAADAVDGTIISNDSLIVSQELLQSIALRARAIVSGDPSARIVTQCGSSVLAGDESGQFTLDYFNDSKNDDNDVFLDLTFPAGITFDGFSHTWNSVAGAAGLSHTLTSQDLGGGTYRFSVIVDGTHAPLGPLAGGTFVIDYTVDSGVPSGTLLNVNQVMTADNPEDGVFVAVARCTTLVSNPNLSLSKLVDQAGPPSGTTVTYTLAVSNDGAHGAPDVVVTDVLPAGMTYVGSPQILTPGWSGATPNVAGQTISWDQLQKSGEAIRYFPGHSETVYISFQARVDGGVGPGVTLKNCADTFTTLTQDGAADSHGDCADVTTPRPDLVVTKSAPAQALPGDKIAYSIVYYNKSRQSAPGAVIVDQFPYKASDLYPGQSEVGLFNVNVSNGEAVYYNAGSLLSAQPVFSHGSPTANGWTTTPGAVVNWIAIVPTGTLPAQSPLYEVRIEVFLRHPTSSVTPLPGATVTNCVAAYRTGSSDDQDEDDTDNSACAETTTPGVDAKAEVACGPESLETRPGDTVSFDIVVTNSGTTPLYGVRVSPAVSPIATFAGFSPPTGAAVDAFDQPASFIDLVEDPINQPVSWTADGADFVLGELSPTSATYFREVALQPGHSVTLTIQATVDNDAANEAEVTSGATVATDYRSDFQFGVDEEESFLSNNSAECAVVVYRPDIVITKDVVNITRADAPAESGDILRYTIAISNLGRAPASGVGWQDLFVDNLEYVPNTFTGPTDGVLSQFTLDDFAWSANQGSTGVRGIRVSFAAGLSTSGGDGMVLTLAPEFALGTFSGTSADATLHAVVPETTGGLSCASGKTNTRPAGRVFTYTLQNFADGATHWTYTFPDAKTECCAVTSAQQTLCEAPSYAYPPPGQSWNNCMYNCEDSVYLSGVVDDDGNVYASVGDWAGCVCNDAYMYYSDLCITEQVDECMTLRGGCLTAAFDECQMYVDGLMDNYWLCQSENPDDPTICGDEPSGLCEQLDGPVYTLDAFGMEVYFYGLDFDTGCQDHFDSGTTCEPMDFELDCSGASFLEDRYGVSTGMLDTMDCPTYPQNVIDEWGADHTALVDGNDCGSLPPDGVCFDEVNCGAPYEAPDCYSCSSGDANVTYTTPLLPGPDEPGAITLWESLTIGTANLASADLNITLVDSSGTAIAGYTDIALPPGGVVALTGLSATAYPELFIQASFSAASQMCVRSIGEINYQQEGFDPYASLPPMLVDDVTDTPVATSDQGAMLYAFTNPNNGDGLYLHIFSPNGSPTTLYAQDVFGIWSDEDGAIGSTPAADMAADGTVVAPAVGYDDATFSDNVAKTQIWLTNGDHSQWTDWQDYLPYDNGTPGEGAGFDEFGNPDDSATFRWVFSEGIGNITAMTTLGRVVAHSNLVAGAAVFGMEDEWVMCQRANFDACEQGLADVNLTYQRWEQCDGWFDCLVDASEACTAGASDPASECSTNYFDPQYTSQQTCAVQYHADGCWEDEMMYSRTQMYSPSALVNDCHFYRSFFESDNSNRTDSDGQGFSYDNTLLPGVIDNYWSYEACAQQVAPWNYGADPVWASFVVWRRTGLADSWSMERLPNPTWNGDPVAGDASMGAYRLLDFSTDGKHILAYDGASEVLFAWTNDGNTTDDNNTWTAKILGPVSPSTTLAGNPAGPRGSVNDGGWAYLQGSGSPTSVYRYDESLGRWTSYSLQQSSQAVVTGVNNQGDAVGLGRPISDRIMGLVATRWLFDAANQVHVPQILPWPQDVNATIVIPAGINDAGTIVGAGFFEDALSGTATASAGVVWSDLGSDLGANIRYDSDRAHSFVLEDTGGFGAFAILEDSRVVGGYDYYYNAGEGSGGDTYGAFISDCFSDTRPMIESIALAYETGATQEFSFDVRVADLCRTTANNTASASAQTTEITLANNSDSANADVNTADLEAFVLLDKVAVSLNDSMTITFEVTNHGPGTAYNVSINGLVAQNTTGTNGSWMIPSLAAGETWTEAVPVTVTTSLPNLSLVSRLDVSSTTIDCDTSNNSGNKAAVTGSWPNLAVSKTGPATATVSTAGASQITYDIAWASDGNDIAINAVITDTLPAGTTFVGASVGATHSAGVVTWNLGDAAAGTGGTVSVTVELPGCAQLDAPTITNRVTIGSDSFEANGADNQDAFDTYLLAPLGRLKAQVFVDRSTVEAAERLHYTVYYMNEGTDDVAGATLVVPLPTNAVYVAGSGTGAPVEAAGALTFDLGTVSADETGAVSFAVTVTGASGDAVDIFADVTTIGGDGACSVSANGVSSDVVDAGLHIVKSVDRSSACGDEVAAVTWTVTVFNNTDATVTGAVVSDDVPNGLSYVGGSITGVGAVDDGAPYLQWAVGDLAPGQGVSLTYATAIPSSNKTVFTNTAAVTADNAPAVVSNAAGLLLDCSTPLELRKSWDAACGMIGDTVDVTVSWTNRTSGAMDGVVITDVLDSNMVFVSSADGFTNAAGVVSLTTNIAAFGSGSATFTARYADGVSGGVLATNQATAQAPDIGAGEPLAAAASNGVTGVTIVCAAAPQCRGVMCVPSTGECVYPAANGGLSCDRVDACSENTVCLAGECVGDAIDCGSSDSCHERGCDPQAAIDLTDLTADGCFDTILVAADCSDGDACTAGDTCDAAGVCQAGAARDCDDGDVCTADSCDPSVGCLNPIAAGASCADDDKCNGAEICTAIGACRAGTALDCDDGDPCTDDSCDPVDGCQNVPNTGGACEDGDACTTNDICQAGVCTGGDALSCSSNNTCQTSTCDMLLGCVLEPVADGSACSDGVFCTAGDSCQAGFCISGSGAPDCGVDTACTTNFCDSMMDSCAVTYNDGAVCDDGDACTGDGACNQGACDSGVDTSDQCPGATDCLLTTCDPMTGCGLSPDTGAACDADGDACTVNDACSDTGVCVAGAAMDCSDDDVCTQEACVNGVCEYPIVALVGVMDDCDGTDDDCDGETDEDFQPVEETCGVGECTGNTGWTECVDGSEGPTCDPLEGASTELCDTFDNDCDGSTDEGFIDTICDDVVVLYLVITDTLGEPIGTARCFELTAGGDLECDTEAAVEQQQVLKVYDALWCPGE